MCGDQRPEGLGAWGTGKTHGASQERMLGTLPNPHPRAAPICHARSMPLRVGLRLYKDWGGGQRRLWEHPTRMLSRKVAAPWKEGGGGLSDPGVIGEPGRGAVILPSQGVKPQLSVARETRKGVAGRKSLRGAETKKTKKNVDQRW